MRKLSTIKARLSGHPGARWGLSAALIGLLALALTTGRSAASGPGAERVLGWRTQLGNGEVSSFVDLQVDGAPQAIGILLSAEALASLPTDHSDGHHCADRNGDGIIARPSECFETHEFVIPLPDAVSRRSDSPFKWVLLNWNLHGHAPPGVYDVPHFDVHFYMTPIAEVFAIDAGPCGPEFVDCDDFAAAKQPLPDDLMHPNFTDVDAIAPAMGNHLIDLNGQEFHGERFTRTWIYGVYQGRVTFYEEMVSLAYLLTRPDSCTAIKAPPAVATAGYYPTQRCVRYDGRANAYVVSIEGFVYREASQLTASDPIGDLHRH